MVLGLLFGPFGLVIKLPAPSRLANIDNLAPVLCAIPDRTALLEPSGSLITVGLPLSSILPDIQIKVERPAIRYLILPQFCATAFSKYFFC